MKKHGACCLGTRISCLVDTLIDAIPWRWRRADDACPLPIGAAGGPARLCGRRPRPPCSSTGPVVRQRGVRGVHLVNHAMTVPFMYTISIHIASSTEASSREHRRRSPSNPCGSMHFFGIPRTHLDTNRIFPCKLRCADWPTWPMQHAGFENGIPGFSQATLPPDPPRPLRRDPAAGRLRCGAGARPSMPWRPPRRQPRWHRSASGDHRSGRQRRGARRR